MSRPKGTTSDSERGDSKLSGSSTEDSARAGAADAADEPVAATDDLLDTREKRQGRGRKKPGPSRTPPADPPAPPADAPPTEL